MADTEIVYGVRVRLILVQHGAPLASFDQYKWVVALHYDKRDTPMALEQFVALRKATQNVLKTITPEQWKEFRSPCRARRRRRREKRCHDRRA